MGFCCERTDGRYEITEAGIERHRSEILKQPRAA
jgi:hypothetical protein